ncbi:GIY-YIG nuclease family protein [Candidatus Peregrinibacteria bacterium]|nr:GIY-YIG nuclease family protein [Candidatus Peregrinibacteria bacterium]
MYYVYVLQNHEGTLYKGHTRDMTKRMREHNAIDGPSRYTKGKGPWILVHVEEYMTRAKAMMREQFLKTGKGREFLSQKIRAPH